MYETKKWLLEQLGIATVSAAWSSIEMPLVMAAARVLCLRQVQIPQRIAGYPVALLIFDLCQQVS